MKWYKHLSKSIDNPFVRQLMYDFGSDAYLVFFGTLEIYADNFSPESDWKLTINLRYFHDKFILSNSKIKNILTKISQNPDTENKWEVVFNNSDVTVFIPKFKKLVDNYTKDTQEKTCKKLASDKQETFQAIKNKDKRIKNKEKDNTPKVVFVLPDYIPKETWEAYLELRNKKRAAKTDYALSLIIKELEKYKPNQLAILNQSIKNGWVDMYPLKENNNFKMDKPIKQESPYEKCPRCGKELRKGYEYTLIGGQKCCEYCPEAREQVKTILGKVNLKSF